MLALLEAALARFAEKPAVEGQRLRLSYGELSDRADRWSRILVSAGVGPADRVVSLLGNSPVAAELLLGVLRSGAAEVALNTQEPLSRLRAVLEEVRPAAIVVTDEELRRQVEQVVPGYTVLAALTESLDKSLVTEQSRVGFAPSAPALIQYTSGTTGAPKGAVFSHTAMATALTAAEEYLSEFAGLRLVLGIPLCHAYGKTCLLEYLLAGGHIFINSGFLLPSQITESIRNVAGQAIEGPPTLYETACRDRKFCSATLPELSYISMNSAKPRESLLRELRRRFPKAAIAVRYGITEVAGPICRLVWRPGEDIPFDSCGRVSRHVRVQLIDDSGMLVPAGQLGEVVVRSDARMSGYLGSSPSDVTEAYRTGDLGKFDSEEMLYLVGRKSRMIKSAGHRIFPGELEEIIVAVTGVEECTVGGVPDDRLGERICAWVVALDKVDLGDLRIAIQSACRSSLPTAKCPHQIVFRASLPKTSNGKVKIDALVAGLTNDVRITQQVRTSPDAASGPYPSVAPILYDNTLRDGEQTVGVAFSAEDKVRIAQQLIRSGIMCFEAGFATISAEEREAIRAVVRSCGSAAREIFSLARLKRKDVQAAAETGVNGVTIFVPSSDAMIQARFSGGLRQIEGSIEDVVSFAAQQGLHVRFSCEDATRTPLDRLVRFYGLAIRAGARSISMPDTVGVSMPEHTFRLMSELKQAFQVPVSVHCHNDLGLAVANSLAAMRAGADIVHVTGNGLGERVGNTNMAEFVLAARVGYGIDLGVDLLEMMALTQLVAELSGFSVSPSTPVIGTHAFQHESGIHVQALLREDLMTYEPFPPEWVGRRHEVAFGKHSGRSNVRYLCRQLSIPLPEDRDQEILAQIKDAHRRLGRNPYRGEVLELILQALQEHVGSCQETKA